LLSIYEIYNTPLFADRAIDNDIALENGASLKGWGMVDE
jgi:hypothetical protein